MWNVCQCEICCCLKNIEDFSKRLLELFFFLCKIEIGNYLESPVGDFMGRLQVETSKGDFNWRLQCDEHLNEMYICQY